MATLASLWRTTLQLLSGLNTCNKKKQQQKTGMSLCHHCNLLLHQGFEQKENKKTASGDKKSSNLHTSAITEAEDKSQCKAQQNKTAEMRAAIPREDISA